MISLTTTAASIAAAKTALAATLAQADQTSSSADRTAIDTALGSLLDIVEVDATRNVFIQMKGNLARGPKGLEYLEVSLTATLVPRA